MAIHMRYLIREGKRSYFSYLPVARENFTKEMTVYDLLSDKYTNDGVKWINIQ